MSGSDELERAINAYQEALKIYTRENYPMEWSQIQNNLGNALAERAERLTGAERLAALDAAIASYDAALLEYRREVSPLHWAATQSNKGNALQELAQLAPGEEQQRYLEAAITSYQAALTVYNLENSPVQWASVMRSLGIAYEARGANISQELSQVSPDVKRQQEPVVVSSKDGLLEDVRLTNLRLEDISKAVRGIQSQNTRQFWQNVWLSVASTIFGVILGWLISLLGSPFTVVQHFIH